MLDVDPHEGHVAEGGAEGGEAVAGEVALGDERLDVVEGLVGLALDVAEVAGLGVDDAGGA